MKVVQRDLQDLEAIKSKHVAAFQTTTGEHKSRLDLLEEEAGLSGKRHLRVEKVLGLEPLTKENADVKQKRKTGTMMLGDDQQLRKAWTAWMEARYEAKQNEISDA